MGKVRVADALREPGSRRPRARPDAEVWLRGFERRRLLSSSEQAVVLEACDGPQAPLLLCPVLLVLASLPWVGPLPLDGVRVAVSLGLLVAVAALAAWSRPHRVRTWLDGSAAGNGDGSSGVESPRLVLDHEPDARSPSGAYAATLEYADGRRWPLLRDDEPDTLLHGVRALLAYRAWPVQCRWGLPESACPWSFEPNAPGAVPHEAQQIVPGARPSRGLLGTLMVMSAFMVADLAFLVSSAAEVADIHPFSIILPALTAGSLVVLTLALVDAGHDLLVGSQVTARRRSWWRTRFAGGVRAARVRGVYLVGTPGSQRHLLVDSADGPIAMPIPDSGADALAQQARRAIVRAAGSGREAVPAARVELHTSHARSSGHTALGNDATRE